MLACVDVHYRDPGAVAACVLFNDWDASASIEEHVAHVDAVAAYEPGAFFKRELPCVLAALRLAKAKIDLVIVDGYVDVAPGRLGLGRHLFEAIDTPVVGVPNTKYLAATHAIEVLRGHSTRALYVTATGLDPHLAADSVRRMAGSHRIPDILRRTDALSRQMT